METLPQGRNTILSDVIAQTIPTAILRNDSRGVRTLRWWTDAPWWQTTEAWQWYAVVHVDESTGGATLRRTRALRPRGEAILVPDGVEIAVSVELRWLDGVNPPPVLTDQRIYITVADGLPQAREVYGGQYGPGVGGGAYPWPPSLALDADANGQLTNSNIYGCRFSTSVQLSWVQTVPGPAALLLGFGATLGNVSVVGASGTITLALDHKVNIVPDPTTVVWWTWHTFE